MSSIPSAHFRESLLKMKYQSEREYEFYREYLKKSKLIGMQESKDLNEIESLQDSFDYFNDLIYSSVDEPEKLIKKMAHEFQKEQIDIDNLKPFNKESERFYNFVWSYINRYPQKINAQFNLSLVDIDRDNSEQRYKDFISLLNNSEATYQEQLSLFEDFSEVWNKTVFPQNKLINWLSDKNKNQWDWAFEYIKNNRPSDVRMAWKLGDDSDKRNVIIATIDIWNNSSDQELFLHKMKRAWSQKKFRDKSDGKKSYSISMTTTTKKKLDKLAKRKELKLNDLIELLIRDEYELNDL